MLHCCGAASELIPEFIDLGGMEPVGLKARFGGQIAFHGAMDTQHTLPFGTPDDVRREVAERREVLGRGGGYILCPCHAIQPDVPIENILAMYEAARV